MSETTPRSHRRGTTNGRSAPRNGADHLFTAGGFSAWPAAPPTAAMHAGERVDQGHKLSSISADFRRTTRLHRPRGVRHDGAPRPAEASKVRDIPQPVVNTAPSERTACTEGRGKTTCYHTYARVETICPDSRSTGSAHLRERQADLEAGVPRLGNHSKISTVALGDHPVRDVQAQARTLTDRLGGEERFEDL